MIKCKLNFIDTHEPHILLKRYIDNAKKDKDNFRNEDINELTRIYKEIFGEEYADNKYPYIELFAEYPNIPLVGTLVWVERFFMLSEESCSELIDHSIFPEYVINKVALTGDSCYLMLKEYQEEEE